MCQIIYHHVVDIKKQSRSHLITPEKIKYRLIFSMWYIRLDKKVPPNRRSCHLDRSNCNVLWFQIGFHFYFNIFAFLYSENLQPKRPRWNLLPILGQIIKDLENKRFVNFSPMWELITVKHPSFPFSSLLLFYLYFYAQKSLHLCV